MKLILNLSVLLCLLTTAHSQETAKEETGNVTYLSDELLDPMVEEQRIDRLKELMASPDLYASGKRQIYKGKKLEAIEFPIGAFGGGHLILDGKGMLKHWKIFNNGDLVKIPNSFFSIRVKQGKSKVVVKALQTKDEGEFKGIDELTFQGEYPFAWVNYKDDELPVELTLEAFNPLIPMDLKNTAIPCAIFSYTATNPTESEIEVSLMYAQQNAVGYRVIKPYGGKNSSREFFKNDTEFINLNKIEGNNYAAYGMNVNEIHTYKNSTSVHLSSLKPDTLPGSGDMVIGLLGEKGTAITNWSEMNSLFNDFSKGSKSKTKNSKPTQEGETTNAAVYKTIVLQPGESRTIPFYLAWHFPNGDRGSYSKNYWGRGKWGGNGNMYTNWWSDALEVSNYIQDNFKRLEEETKRYHQSFYNSNYPQWLKDRISAQTSILKTNTMFWDQDGYIGGWEGISPIDGACSGNCTHVWHYAQSNARLFPEMGRQMRKQSFSFMKDDGMIPYRHPNGHEAFDGQCGEILQAYREHLMSEDNNWLEECYPKVIKAMDFVIETWDKDKNGVLEGAKHNTLDSRLGGNSAWHGSLYAAALRATARMAEIKGETEYASELIQLSDLAVESHLTTLWNGEYFIQIPDSVPRADFLTGCATDQLLGQWWANQLKLGKLYPEYIEKKTMESIFKYNFKANFNGLKQNPREFVKSDEAGLLMITWPKGGRPHPHTSYADEVMSGFEYAAAATMIECGKINEGLAIVKAVSDRYTGELKVGYDGAWGNFGYSGNPFGDDECGKFYSRAMSNWSVLMALQGYDYDGPNKSISFNPVWQPEDHVSFFTTARAWGNYKQERKDKSQVSTIKVEYGTLDLKEFNIGISGMVMNVDVNINDKQLKAVHKVVNNQLQVQFENLTLKEGDVIKVSIQLGKGKVIAIPGTLDRPGPAGWSKGGVWIDQHNDICQIGKTKSIDLVFIGNSITQSWCSDDRNVWGAGQAIWDEYYKNRKAANFGISGDKVENILWRIENGNFDSVTPKVIVLHAGTNNLNTNSETFIVDGISEIIMRLQSKLENTKIIVMGILPRGQYAHSEYREKIKSINKRLKEFSDDKTIFYVDLASVYLKEDKEAKQQLYRSDFIHLSVDGYKAWAESLEPMLRRLL